MFCDGCGAAVQPGQAYCSGCGKQIVGVIRAMQMTRGRVAEHVQLLGILWLAISAINAVGGVVLYIVANTIFAPGRGGEGQAFLHPLLSHPWDIRPGKIGSGIYRRLWLDAARRMGPRAGAAIGLHFAVQYSLRYGDRRLHDLGAAARSAQSRNTKRWSHPGRPHSFFFSKKFSGVALEE